MRTEERAVGRIHANLNTQCHTLSGVRGRVVGAAPFPGLGIVRRPGEPIQTGIGKPASVAWLMREGVLASTMRCFTVQGHEARRIRAAVLSDKASLSLHHVQPRRDDHPRRDLIVAPGIRLFEADTEQTQYTIWGYRDDLAGHDPVDVILTVTALSNHTTFYDKPDRPTGEARIVTGTITVSVPPW